jgi:Mce-associated membrane protein
MSESRPPRRRVAGERSRLRRADPGEYQAPVTAAPTTTEEAPAGRPDRPAAEPSAAPLPPAGEGSSRPRWLYVVGGGLAVIALVAAVVAGVLAVRLADADPNDPPDPLSKTRSDALAAARSHAQEILSYDHRTLDADFAKAEAALTGKFKRDYTRTTSTVVRPSAEQYKVVVKADVTAASVVRADDHRVVTLLFVDQTTTSTRLEGPKVDLNRVRMTLVEQDGKWLVSELDAL